MARVAHLHPALGLLDGRLVAVNEDTQNRSEELPRSVHGPAAASACARVEGRLDCGGDPGLGLPADLFAAALALVVAGGAIVVVVATLVLAILGRAVVVAVIVSA